MIKYKLTGKNWVYRAQDGARISTVDTPEYPNTNPDYLAYREWLDAGGVPEPADPPSPEEMRERFKSERAKSVASIIVTTKSGNTFDGHEDAQSRMARAIIGLNSIGGTMPWVLADNSVVEVDVAELAEALTLSGAEQSRLWVAIK